MSYQLEVVFIHEQFKAAPLSSTFMIVSILGIIFSLYYMPKVSIKFAAAFTTVFLLMFISSFISMSKAPMNDKTFENDLSVHEHHKHPRHGRIEKKE